MPWNLAIRMVGSEEAITAGVNENTWKPWRRPEIGVPAYRIVKVLRERAVRAIAKDSGATERHKAPWYRNARTFTALVEMLVELERGAANDKDIADRRQSAWRVLVAVRPVIEQIARWDDEKWRLLEASKKDHWRRVSARRETDEISAALQEEFPW